MPTLAWLALLLTSLPEPVPGRYKGVQVGIPGDPAADYAVGYGYDALGRLNSVTGPGLPAAGANYGFVANSDLVGQIDFKSDAATTIASTTRTFEPTRDLIDLIENRWAANPTPISKYDYRSDALGRRKDVVTTGSAALKPSNP